jgi:hypothetical protein
VAFPALAEAYGETFIGRGRGPALKQALASQPLRDAVVFLPTNNEALNDPLYTLAMSLNSPDLDGDVIFVRDYGDAKNPVFMRHFPNRKAYRLVAPREAPPRFEAITSY